MSFLADFDKSGKAGCSGDDYRTIHNTWIRGQFCRKDKRFPRFYVELATRPDVTGNFLNGVMGPSNCIVYVVVSSLSQCLRLPSTKTSRDTASIAFEPPGRLPGAWLGEAGRGWKVLDKFLRERLTVNLDLWVPLRPHTIS
ncbi:Uncharacterized protein APZ42_027399 [Daphnia magna]|uniref:Uncharacterized protein n=1 Tax=Daphnia magna TaxID=35525 RepID=A0A164RJ47_9CRUS|nr:Uncharacterized protein APZ42_027399 [Daphnia magna]